MISRAEHERIVAAIERDRDRYRDYYEDERAANVVCTGHIDQLQRALDRHAQAKQRDVAAFAYGRRLRQA